MSTLNARVDKAALSMLASEACEVKQPGASILEGNDARCVTEISGGGIAWKFCIM